MSDNTSLTPGYIQQTSAVSLNDEELTTVFQELVVGLTGLDPTLVRPRWQPQPPTQPPATTDWSAIGIISYTAYDYPDFILDPDGESATLSRLERIDLIATFYGPNSAAMAGYFRDGLYVQQNHQTLSAHGVKLRSADDITHLPELINSQYVSRSDVPLSFMRMVGRTYQVKAITSAQVTVATDSGLSCVEDISQETP